MLVFNESYGMQLKDTLGENEFVIARCQGLHKTLKDYHKDFPWVKNTLGVLETNLIDYLVDCAKDNLDVADIYDSLVSDFCSIDAETGWDDNDIHYQTPEQKNMHFSLNDDLQNDTHISFISKIIELVGPTIKNNNDKYKHAVVLKGDYFVYAV
jgi:hypothetical protein